MSPVNSETSMLHYEKVMQEAHLNSSEMPAYCRRDALEKLMILEEKIGIYSVNFIDEFHRISMSLQKAVIQLYSRKPTCRKVTRFLHDLSAARNCQDLLMVADEVHACFLEDACCETEE
jgi:hypothetical protein